MTTSSNRKKLVLAAGLLTAAVAVFLIRGSAPDLQTLAEREAELKVLHRDHPLLSISTAFLVYVLVTGLSLPGATILTLVFAWFFGFWPALILVSFASTGGATVAFLSSRYLLRDSLRQRFGDRLQSFDDALRADGAFYLFLLRLIPVVPFFVINLVMGLTPLKTRTFWWVSQVGMLPGTLVYVYAGASVPDIASLAEQGIHGILTPNLLFAFVLLGVTPLALRKAVQRWKPGRL
ncbi:MAG: TVP38/TMEM64 family protein [Planctomycetaceae bacterium]|nr:TVP38/TMEM64 family protein [Planctomycetaceae bacterium]